MIPTLLRVGILGADSEAVRTIYLPILQSLNQYFAVTVLHSALSNATATDTPRITPSIDDVINDPSVTLILNFMPNEYHEAYTIAALEAGKHVMVETPLSLSIRSTRRILEAEKRAPDNAKVFVACARRHVPCLGLLKTELAALDRIYYARCRNIAGPHPAHPATAPLNRAAETETADAGPGAQQLRQSLLEEVFSGQELSAERVALCQFLASLGCHDLGLMRHALGAPDTISSISVNDPFYSAIFHYTGRAAGGGHPFTLVYETGTDSVPRCDAHLAIYGRTKTVSVYYDLPYARDWTMRVVVEERDERGELKVTESASSWEDGYREELKTLYAFVVEGKPVKTTAADGLEDLKLFRMMFEQYDRQCGTIRTPLG
ncbi:Gfo/Idh/MocA family oxidoreductase [Aspergillus clavatus NRRL 1]|uniref:NAD binding Rossmann fold oxidoreductase, putative n=1 Tax=Aspergillus clavatus (strain ATCC 1007 / CBS 513.65 / DSM 816 / NCTC 3887 / NRRL 1 / QM 1276 / 107) TaxID=344612 RepID=A1CHW4_ASPCL|nr:NAD binding Rossmann fold oxidoreductase, putative [Aspergillus clavatus NRRL 1]EAW10469.1 NAD binding Rossmann fold oxidoreductase, putative [Aspergillus clavatus NRRL 1]